jgi:hypothetical protein
LEDRPTAGSNIRAAPFQDYLREQGHRYSGIDLIDTRRKEDYRITRTRGGIDRCLNGGLIVGDAISYRTKVLDVKNV